MRVGHGIAGALVFFAVLSLVVDAVVIFEIWHIRSAVDTQLATSVKLADDTLATSDQALTVVDSQVQTVGTLATSAGGAAQSSTRTIQATHQALQQASHLLRTDLPTTLTTVHTAVASAQSTAGLVDDILGALSFIPGLRATYNPQVPLHVALGNVAQSLDTLPGLTAQLADDVDSVDANLPAAQTEVAGVATTLQQNPVDTTQMHNVVAQYRDEVSRLQDEIQGLQVAVSLGMTWIAIAVTFLACWLAIIQAAVLFAGLHWLRGHHVLAPIERPRRPRQPIPFAGRPTRRRTDTRSDDDSATAR
jgi:hypothetical protein